MQDPISDCRFVNSAQFWITDVKRGIMGMLVSFVFQFAVKLEQIVFQIKFKPLDVNFFPFVFPEFLPSQKQVFQRNNFLKNILMTNNFSLKTPPPDFRRF